MAYRRLANFVDRQAVGSLAIPCLTQRQRTELLALREVTVGHARLFLQGVERQGAATLSAAALALKDSAFPATNEGTELAGLCALARSFNTDQRVDQLRKSLARFDTTVAAWTAGEIRNPRYDWVLPNRLLAAALDGRLTSTVRERLGLTPLGRALLTSAQDLVVWLPFLSLEGALAIDKLRAPDYPVLSLLLKRGAASLGYDSQVRPWLPRFPRKLAALPITWLYQFEPSRRAATVLLWLERGGLHNVGQLAVLHGEGFKWVRKTPPETWRSVQQSFLNHSAAAQPPLAALRLPARDDLPPTFSDSA